jgi:hypothetical protein
MIGGAVNVHCPEGEIVTPGGTWACATAIVLAARNRNARRILIIT